MYFNSSAEGDDAFYRTEIKSRRVERVASLASVKRPASQSFGAWTGLAPDDAPLALRDISSMRSTRWTGSYPSCCWTRRNATQIAIS